MSFLKSLFKSLFTTSSHSPTHVRLGSSSSTTDATSTNTLNSNVVRTDIEGRSRYRREGCVYCIDIYISDIHQLFDRRDPSPFREKDLDEDLVKYLILSWEELPDDEEFQLVINMPKESTSPFSEEDLELAIHNFFLFESESNDNDLEFLFKQGRIALAMATVFLAMCTFLSSWIPAHQNLIFDTLKEGLHIIGWVALWRPLNIFLYDWLPFIERRKMFKKLSTIDIKILPVT